LTQVLARVAFRLATLRAGPDPGHTNQPEAGDRHGRQGDETVGADVRAHVEIADLVGSKQALFTGLFDGTTDEVTFERGGGFLSRIERIVGPAMTPDPARHEDDSAERAIEAVVAAGDESRDGPSAAAAGPDPLPSHADIERLLSGLRVQSTASGGLVIEAPPDTASTLAALFAGMAQLLRANAAPPARGGDFGKRP
jgi:hypothetical protein